MRPVKTRQKFHCDFCSKTSTKEAMERHERICWGNPERVCGYCDGSGFFVESYDDIGLGPMKTPCYYCGQRDPDRLPRGVASTTERETAFVSPDTGTP